WSTFPSGSSSPTTPTQRRRSHRGRCSWRRKRTSSSVLAGHSSLQCKEFAMKTRLWLAAAVLAATVPTIAMAQGPAAPTAPRPAAGAGATGAPADGKIAVINTSVFGEKILELKTKADVVNKKY